MPKGLTGRLLLAFAATGLVAVLAVGGALFVVLRELHRDAEYSRLRAAATTILAQGAGRFERDNVTEVLASLHDELAGLEITVIFVPVADRPLVTLAGEAAPADPLPAGPTTRGEFRDAALRFDDGRTWATTTIALQDAGPLGTRSLLLATPDAAGAGTVADLVRTIPLVALAVALVGGPLAWRLARSTTRPLRRLAAATATIPAGEPAPPLPLSGPSEVRELTERFGTMAGELAEARHAEADLLANLRHDLRTPLTVIGGFAEALVDGTATGDAAQVAARAIRDETGRLARLVDELGAIEGLRSGVRGLRPEPLEPAAVIADAARQFGPGAAAAGVALTTEAGAGLPEMVADRLAVERMVANLLDNALRAVADRAAPDGDGPRGTILLAARAAQLPGDRPAVALSVGDDGPGFPPGALERAFERSYRGDPARSGRGSGLGLAIVRELAAAHGGTTVAENLAPHGARVSVLLPLVPAVPDAAPGNAPATPPGAAPGSPAAPAGADRG